MIDCPICYQTKPPSDFFSHQGNGTKHPFCKLCLNNYIHLSNKEVQLSCPVCREPIEGLWKKPGSLTQQETKIYLKAAAILGFSGLVLGAAGGAAFALYNEVNSLESCVFHSALFCSLTGIYTILLAWGYRD
jgi:hypothetical protein